MMALVTNSLICIHCIGSKVDRRLPPIMTKIEEKRETGSLIMSLNKINENVYHIN